MCLQAVGRQETPYTNAWGNRILAPYVKPFRAPFMIASTSAY